MRPDQSPAPGDVGVIGLGEIGQVHAAAVRAAGSARLAAVADTAPDLLPPFEAQGVRGYPDAAALIADAQVGTVCVCLPHHLHFPVALEAIRAGKNVLVEKPLTTSPDEGQRLVDAAAKAGVALGVSHNQVFYAPHVEAKRLIDTGEIGRPVHIRLRLSLFAGYRTGPALSMFRDRQWREVPVRPDDWRASVQASVTAYLDAVTAGREPPVTGVAALETVRLLQRIYDTAVVLSPGRHARP
jgi:predicted dehydrogenase